MQTSLVVLPVAIKNRDPTIVQSLCFFKYRIEKLSGGRFEYLRQFSGQIFSPQVHGYNFA
jgi:hypothetical protein